MEQYWALLNRSPTDIERRQPVRSSTATRDLTPLIFPIGRTAPFASHSSRIKRTGPKEP
jgi:hypothetical protein